MGAGSFRKGGAADGAGDISGDTTTGAAVQRDPTTLKLVTQDPLGRALDLRRTARGANQGFLVPVCRDQNQRFGRTVLFNTPTSHGLPFRQGFMARKWLYPA